METLAHCGKERAQMKSILDELQPITGDFMSFPNRTLCDVLKEMRTCNETRNYSYLLGLIEEAQHMGYRMEAALFDQKDLYKAKKELDKVSKELKALRKEKESLENEKDQIQKD